MHSFKFIQGKRKSMTVRIMLKSFEQPNDLKLGEISTKKAL